MAAIREVINRPGIPDEELTGIAGPPYFMTGCTVTGNLTALAAGQRTELRLQAHLTISDDGSEVIIGNIPPNASTDDVASTIANRARVPQWADRHPDLHRRTYLPLGGIRDETHDRTSPYGRIICVPGRGILAGQLRDMLLDIPGVYTTMPVALPQPLPIMIKDWVHTHTGEDVPASLAALEQALRDEAR